MANAARSRVRRAPEEWMLATESTPKPASPPRPVLKATKPCDQVEPSADTQKERLKLRNMWELACVLNFLHTFRTDLQLHGFTSEELESALLARTITELLSRIHMTLLLGIHSRSGSTITAYTWAAKLFSKLADGWEELAEGPNPLGHLLTLVPKNNPDPAVVNDAYVALDAGSRVRLLRALCELRLEEGTPDLRLRVEAATQPPPRGDPARASWAGLDLYRATPLGTDSKGTVYWYEDHHFTTGARLYSEKFPRDPKRHDWAPAKPLPKGKKRKKAGRPPAPVCPDPPPPPKWTCAATDAGELSELAEPLANSRNKTDRRLGTEMRDRLVPELERRAEKEDRQRRAMTRLKLDTAIILDAEGGYGRSRRHRKAVSYTDDEYNEKIDDAIKYANSRQVRQPAPEPALPHAARTPRLALPVVHEHAAQERRDWEGDAQPGARRRSLSNSASDAADQPWQASPDEGGGYSDEEPSASSQGNWEQDDDDNDDSDDDMSIPTWNRTAHRSQGLDQQSDVSEDDSDNDRNIPFSRPMPGHYVSTTDAVGAQQQPGGWSPPNGSVSPYTRPAPDHWAQQVRPAVSGMDAGMDRANGRDVNWESEDESEDEEDTVY